MFTASGYCYEPACIGRLQRIDILAQCWQRGGWLRAQMFSIEFRALLCTARAFLGRGRAYFFTLFYSWGLHPRPPAGIWGPGTHLGGSVGGPGTHLGGTSGRPKADIMEAEGRLNGGLGAEPPGRKKSLDFFKTSVKPTKLHCATHIKSASGLHKHLKSMELVAQVCWMCIICFGKSVHHNT